MRSHTGRYAECGPDRQGRPHRNSRRSAGRRNRRHKNIFSAHLPRFPCQSHGRTIPKQMRRKIPGTVPSVENNLRHRPDRFPLREHIHIITTVFSPVCLKNIQRSLCRTHTYGCISQASTYCFCAPRFHKYCLHTAKAWKDRTFSPKTRPAPARARIRFHFPKTKLQRTRCFYLSPRSDVLCP